MLQFDEEDEVDEGANLVALRGVIHIVKQPNEYRNERQNLGEEIVEEEKLDYLDSVCDEVAPAVDARVQFNKQVKQNKTHADLQKGLVEDGFSQMLEGELQREVKRKGEDGHDGEEIP